MTKVKDKFVDLDRSGDSLLTSPTDDGQRLAAGIHVYVWVKDFRSPRPVPSRPLPQREPPFPTAMSPLGARSAIS